MIIALILILFILWVLGYIPIQNIAIPHITLFMINGQAITLWNLLIFFVIVWAIGVLPVPIRWIAGIVFILWVLSVLGIIAIPGLAGLLVLLVIIGLIASLFLP